MGIQLCEALLGFCFGTVIASATVAFIISLGIVPRFAGITRSANRVMLYEDCSMAGAVLATVFSISRVHLPLGIAGLLIFGTFTGIYLGSWIIALGEVVNIYSIMARRIGLSRGIGWIIIAMALGKMLGSLIFFYKGWW